MRAVYFEDLNILDDNSYIEGKKAHHLLNVIRLKKQERILLLDGKGVAVEVEVSEISKKRIDLNIIKKIIHERKLLNISLAFCKTKKEAFELSLKQLIEIGVPKIYIVASEFSQKYEIKEDRLKSILVSALEQSNSYHLPEIEYLTLEELMHIDGSDLIYFSSVGSSKGEVIVDNSKKYILLLGPEGGLSSSEEKEIIELKQSKILHLPTNILRTSTAVSFCTGYIIAKMTD